jgi:hypothetical protein
MSAIERCRTAALGGHVARCENEACGHTIIAYNSCRNRHCPKCQGSQAREWLEARKAELLEVTEVAHHKPAPKREPAPRETQRPAAAVPTAKATASSHPIGTGF